MNEKSAKVSQQMHRQQRNTLSTETDEFLILFRSNIEWRLKIGYQLRFQQRKI